MRISDWSSDVCSSDLAPRGAARARSLRHDAALRLGRARSRRPLVSPPPARARQLGRRERIPASAGLLYPLALAAHAARDARASPVVQVATSLYAMGRSGILTNLLSWPRAGQTPSTPTPLPRQR